MQGPSRLVRRGGAGDDDGSCPSRTTCSLNQRVAARRWRGLHSDRAARGAAVWRRTGCSKLVRRGIKLEHLGEEYSPEKDSVIAAMVPIVVARVRPAGDPEA